MKFLDGKKTYLTAGMIAGCTFAKIVGWITEDQYQTILGLLGAFGLYALRDGIKKLE